MSVGGIPRRTAPGSAIVLAVLVLAGCHPAEPGGDRLALLSSLPAPSRPENTPMLEVNIDMSGRIVQSADFALVASRQRIYSRVVNPHPRWTEGFAAWGRAMDNVRPAFDRITWLNHMDDFQEKLRRYGAVRESGRFISFRLPLGWPLRQWGPYSSFEYERGLDRRHAGGEWSSYCREGDASIFFRFPVAEPDPWLRRTPHAFTLAMCQDDIDRVIIQFVREVPELLEAFPDLPHQQDGRPSLDPKLIEWRVFEVSTSNEKKAGT